MSVPIITRAQWGAKPWDNNPKSSGPATVALSQRTEFFVHYDGATPIVRTGAAIPRAIEAQHLAQGWAGIGYSFVVDQAGNIYEGRGWDRQGAHCPGHNVSGLSVQIAVGGDQEPTPAALAAARALYDEACRKTGRGLAKRGHKDGIATLCPGARLYAWVQAGMPAPTAPPAGGSSGGTAPTGSTYTIRPGDTLSAIATAHGTTVSELARLNGIADPNRITAGTELKVPGKSSTPAAPSKPKPYAPPKFPAGLTPNRATPSARTLQRALKAAGFLAKTVAEADNYGPQTQTAVGKFHNAHPQYRSQGVSYDPAIGPKGWAALFTLAYGK